MRYIAGAVVTVILFFGCVKKEPEFFKLDLATHPFLEKPDSINQQTLIIKEVYVIVSPPGNPDKLRKVVEVFNAKTLHLPDSSLRFCYHRTFYKETRNTPRSYKEDERSGDDISDHWNDLLLKIEWGKSECGDYTHYTFYKNEVILDDKSFSIIHKKDCR